MNRDELIAEAKEFVELVGDQVQYYPSMDGSQLYLLMADFALSLEPATRKAAVDAFLAAVKCSIDRRYAAGQIEQVERDAMDEVYAEMFPTEEETKEK